MIIIFCIFLYIFSPIINPFKYFKKKSIYLKLKIYNIFLFIIFYMIYILIKDEFYIKIQSLISSS